MTMGFNRMKNFRQYLTESTRSYRYKISVAHDPKIDIKEYDIDRWVKLFIYNLTQKFDAIKIGDPTTTPVQPQPGVFRDVSDAKNISVTHFDCEFRYPATDPMIKQIAKLLGYNENYIRVTQSDYSDSLDSERKQYENQPDSLLADAAYEDTGDASKRDAAKSYGDSYLSDIEKQRGDSKIEMSYAAKVPKNDHNPFDPKNKNLDQRSTRSPLSSVKMPAKPQTGRSK
jgi:hypothetical protein